MYKISRDITYYFIITCVILVVIAVLSNYHPYTNPNYSDQKGSIIKFNFTRIVDVDRKDIFNVMRDVPDYPKILPNSVTHIKILNQTNNSIYASEQLSENGITTNLLVKHNFYPFEQQSIKVKGGDANQTTITETFEEDGISSTKITSNIELHLHGILEPFGFVARSNIEHAMNTVIDNFVTYAKIHR